MRVIGRRQRAGGECRITAHMHRYTVATSAMLTDVFGAGCGLLFVDWIGTCAWLVDVGVGLQYSTFTGDAYFRVRAYIYFFGECWRCLGLDWRVVRSYHLLV